MEASVSSLKPLHALVVGGILGTLTTFVGIHAISSINRWFIYGAFDDRVSRRKRRMLKDLPETLKNCEYTKELIVSIDLALQAGDNILRANQDVKSHMVKGDLSVDFVTKTDKENEKLIFEKLSSKFPDYKFIGEESSADAGKIDPLTSAKTFIVDPIDGTTNFVHSNPFCCVSIGLCHNNAPVMGVVYNPEFDELYMSIKGKGAYLNGKKLRVTDVKRLKDALVLTEFGYQRDEESLKCISDCLINMLIKGGHAMRHMGSGVLNLCYVAAGRLDVCYAGVAGESWKPWDYAAGMLFVTEAGGCLSEVNGETFHTHSESIVAASTKELKNEVVASVEEIKSKLQAGKYEERLQKALRTPKANRK